MDDELKKKYENQGRMLANRALKKYRHLRKRFARQNITVFRLYDWDIPEIRAVVDWYDGCLVIGEYARKQSTPEWLPMMGAAVSEALGVPVEKLFLKTRRSGIKDGKRYERIQHKNLMIPMRERDLAFYINPSDYVDTGLFSDHRNTRQMVREMAKGKRFLNLYCYTGAFTCYAALGGAEKTVSVDRSRTAIRWAGKNLELNRLPSETNILIQQDTQDFLKDRRKTGEKFDLAVIDPPSYSTTRVKEKHVDIARDHAGILNQLFELMEGGGVVFFSTNHQNFELKTAQLKATEIREITKETIPEDYVNKRKQIHRCWEIVV